VKKEHDATILTAFDIPKKEAPPYVSHVAFASGRVANHRGRLAIKSPRRSKNPTHSTGCSTADFKII